MQVQAAAPQAENPAQQCGSYPRFTVLLVPYLTGRLASWHWQRLGRGASKGFQGSILDPQHAPMEYSVVQPNYVRPDSPFSPPTFSTEYSVRLSLSLSVLLAFLRPGPGY